MQGEGHRSINTRGPIGGVDPTPPLTSCAVLNKLFHLSLGFLTNEMGLLTAVERFCED